MRTIGGYSSCRLLYLSIGALTFLLCNLLPSIPVSAQMHHRQEDKQIVFPDKSGVVNVKTDYGAKGDGLTDDTAALQLALSAFPGQNKILYLPNGTYRISTTLRWPEGTTTADKGLGNVILQGQSQNGTILQLRDHAPGYTDPQHAKAVLTTGLAPAYHFRNSVQDLTIDTGHGNAGAIGIQFNASQQGSIQDVTIHAQDGQGVTGLDLSYTDEIGPLLVKNVSVDGYQVGVQSGYTVNSQTFEHLTLTHQRVYGLYNAGQALSLHNVQSNNAVPALANATGDSHLVLIDAHLVGEKGAEKVPAIWNKGVLFARNVTTAGYQQAIQSSSGGNSKGPNINEFVSHPAVTLFQTPTQSLNLPIKETPEVPWDDPTTWANIQDYGGQPGQDVSDAVQQAIDSGATTVYFPNGTYQLKTPVIIRGKVRRILGTEASLTLADGITAGFVLVDGQDAAPVVVVERFACSQNATPLVQNDSQRTLVLRDTANAGGNMTGPGDVYLEDVSSSAQQHWSFHRQHIWARQLNVMSEGTHITNEGGTLWILGLRSERGGTVIETSQAGQTEVLGGLSYTTTDPATAPMFKVSDASLSVSLRETSYMGTPFQTLVQESQGDQHASLKSGKMPLLTFGSDLPLYAGRHTDATGTATPTPAPAGTATPAPTAQPTQVPGQPVPLPVPTQAPPPVATQVPPPSPPLPGPLFFSTGFEAGQPQPSWVNTPTNDITNVAGLCCGLSGPELVVIGGAGFGSNALLYSGADQNASTSYAYMKAFDFSNVNMTVGAGTRLSYWIFPQSSAMTGWVSGSNSTCVALDLVFSDGSNSRNLGNVDQHGNRVHPALQCNRLRLDTWNYVTTTLGAGANGKRVMQLDVGYDQGPGTGGYRGYIDNVNISN